MLVMERRVEKATDNSRRRKSVVAETAALAVLLKAGQGDLLRELFDPVCVGSLAWAELLTEANADLRARLNRASWVKRKMVHADRDRLAELGLPQSSGESLTLAALQGFDYLLTDDADVVAAAARAGVTTISSAAVLVAAKQRGLIDSVRQALLSLIAAGYTFSGWNQYHKILELAGEEQGEGIDII